MAGFSIADFFASVSFKADDASRSRAEGSYAKFEKAVRDAEARIEKAKRDGAKAAVRYALEIEAAQAREALEAAKTAAKVVAAEELKTKAQAQGAKHSADHSAAFVRGMTAMTLAAGTAGLAITAAIVKISQSFETLYFTSQRTGASVSNIKGLSYAFTQVGSTGGSAVAAIESFARAMRTNPGIGGFVRSLGVATQEGGKARDTLDVLSDAVDKIATKHPYYTGAQMAELLGLDESQFETFNRYRKEIKDYRAEYEASLKAVGLNSAEAAKQSEHFQQALRRIGMQVSVAGQSLLVSLLPMLDRLAATISRFMTENAPALNGFFSKVGEVAQSAATGLEGFIKGFSGEEGAKRIQAWADAMNNLADGMRGVWRVIAWIQDSTFWKALTYFESPLWQFLKYAGGSAVGSAQAAVPGGGAGGGSPAVQDNRNAWQRNAPKWLGGQDAPGAGSDGGRQIKPTSKGIDPTVEAYIRKAAIARGINPDTAVGIADGEGLGGSTPNRLTPGDFKNGKATSFGPFQLHRGGPGSVGTEYEKATGHSADDPAHWQEQIDFALSWAKKNGWAAWYGRSKHNIGVREGLNYDGGASQSAGNVPAVGGVGGVDQKQGGATRNQPITEALKNQIAQAAAAAGVNAEIYSGGQDESGPNRTGSHRHDHGKSADLKLYTIGADGKRRYLDMTNEGDRKVMEGFIRESVKAGANGVGAATDYMGPNGIHVGGGSPAAWGAGGSTANAPDWVRRAHQQGMEQRARADAPAAANQNLPSVGLPDFGKNFNPGATDVGKMTAGQPMGAAAVTTNTTNAGATVTMQPTTHVTIQGGDPASNAAQFERAAGRVNDLALRNAQTAIR